MRSLKGIFLKQKKIFETLLILTIVCRKKCQSLQWKQVFILDITESMVGYKIGDFVILEKDLLLNKILTCR